MSSPEPIPPPNDRRSSRASSNASPPASANLNVVSAPADLLVLRRSRVPKCPPDMHLLEYVAQPDSNLVCLICHSPFDKPVQLLCEHYFCRECLDHAWENQPRGCKTCPTCRSSVDPEKDVRPVPRIIDTMLNELAVKCPNAKTGCDWINQRGNVHDHVMLYCEYTLVACPSIECKLHISQKDFHKGCLHYTVNCEHCHTSMMKKDFEEHQRTTCPHRATSCPHCSTEILRLDLKAHIKEACGKVVVSCQGTVVGCTYTAERTEALEHEKACPMAKMAPHFREQQARIDRNEARLEPLSRKVSILEAGLSNITNMLYPANANDSSFPVTNPLDPNTSESFQPASLIPTPDFRLPPASFPPVPPNNDTSQTPFSNPAQPPFDSQIHHLLTLHDSLRDEVSRIANGLTELEGRTNMLIINESQRAKDEMLHTNAAMNNMRMQLHWLMSATISQRASSSGSSTARTGASTNASGSGSNATQGTSASLGNRSGTSGTLHHAPLRRLSDSTRQDTKL